MEDILLSVSELEAGYEGFKIRDADFNLESGSIMGLVGKSGSGKSTLIKALLGINEPESGNVWVTVDGDEKHLKDVSGYSPQDNALYPFLSIKENFEVFGKLRDVEGDDVEKRMKDLLLDLGIYDARNKRVDQLSGGMAKRADLAVAMLHDPEIIVLDEPFSGIDPPQRDIIWEVLEDSKDEGKIVMLTSHMLPDLMKHCDEYGLVHKGEFHNTEEIMKILDSTKYSNLHEMFRDIFRL